MLESYQPDSGRVFRVNHADEGDRDLLRQVYAWAEANPAIYLEGSGYRDAESFLDPPIGSVEFIAFADDRPVALVTLIPLATVPRVYQVGLITNPEASLRKICKLLREFMGTVFEAMAQALFVDLPDSPEFSKTRRLASFFGFKQTSDTIFLQTRTDHGNTQRPEADADAELNNDLPGRVHVLSRDGGGAGAQELRL
jgi:hypothetical protein